jgi:hypothetical protein
MEFGTIKNVPNHQSAHIYIIYDWLIDILNINTPITATW